MRVRTWLLLGLLALLAGCAPAPLRQAPPPLSGPPGSAAPGVLRTATLPIPVDLHPDLDPLVLTPFPDVRLVARRTRAEVEPDGTVLWAGRLEGRPASRVHLAGRAGALAGVLADGSRAWRIRRLGDGLLAVDEVDLPALPPCGVDIPAGPPPEPEPRAREEPLRLDVLVAATSAARRAAAPLDPDGEGLEALDLELRAQALAGSRVFHDSGVPLGVRVVGCREVAYEESGDSALDLQRLRTDGDGFLDEVHALRRDLGADQATLLVDRMDDGNGGLGLQMTRETMDDFGPRAFSVVRHASLPDLTFVHELGHNLGLGHEPPAPGPPPLEGCASAFVDPRGRFRTLMARGALPMARLPLLSSPLLQVEGTALGSETQDNARVARSTAPILAGLAPETGDRAWPWLAAIGLAAALVGLARFRRPAAARPREPAAPGPVA